MKILAVADEENDVLWNYFQPKMVKDVDLVVSCGDLDREYLDFFYTHGLDTAFLSCRA